MAINPLELVMLARDQLTELPESVIFSRENLRGLIPSAIALWQERTNKNPDKRQNFIRESDDIAVRNGVADFSDAIDEYGFKLEYIKDGDIAISYEKQPSLTVKFVNSLDRLKLGGRQDKFFIKAYLSGTRITFKNPDASGDANPLASLNTKFKLRSCVMPDELSDIPASIAPELALVLAEIAKGEFRQQNRGLDILPGR